MDVDELSAEVEYFQELQKKGIIGRIRCFLWYHARRLTNTPLRFFWVGEAGEKVGEELQVVHYTFHDMMEHAVNGELNRRVILEGLRANAFEKIKTKHLPEGNRGITTYQPRWITA